MYFKTLCLVVALLILTVCSDARKTGSGRSRGSSSRNTSRRTNNPQPAPTSYGTGTGAAAGGTGSGLFGWQTSNSQAVKPAQQSHSYPSSQTGLSGSRQATPNQQHTYPQSNAQPAHTYPQSNAQPAHTYPQSNVKPAQTHPGQSNIQPAHTYPAQTNVNQQSHGYPPSGGLSGHSGTGAQQGHGYPPSNGLSGSGHSGGGAGYPQGGGLSGAPPPYPGGKPGNNYPTGGAYPTNNGGYQHPQGPPPPYPGGFGSGYGSHNTGYGGHNTGYGGYGSGMGGFGGGGPPGYFGGYNNRGGGVSRGGSALKGIGIAGAGVGTLLTGLALWNLARSTGQHRHTVIYDQRGQPVAVQAANNTEPAVDPLLGELVNCSLTVSTSNSTDVIGIPCSIATSFSPGTEPKTTNEGASPADDTRCTVGLMLKNGTEFTTTIPCSLLLKTAADNNVTEPPPPPPGSLNDTDILAPYPGAPLAPYPPQTPLPGEVPSNITSAQLALNPANTTECELEPGKTPDPLNPCVPITHDLSVVPLENTSSAPAAAA